MSLFSSIQLANNSLRATQIGLQVVGQNIANANTPGYIREEVNFKPAPSQRVGGLLLGLGVQVDSVVQKIDYFLESRLRGSTSDRVSSETQEQTFQQLEGLIGELGDNGLSTSINDFFSSLSEVLNQPESVSVRNLAVLKGKTLAQDISHLQERVSQVRGDVNKRVNAVGDDINRLVEQIRKLNLRIAETEGGDVSKSDAVGLRDQRNQALAELSKLIDIRVEEQPSGGLAIFAGGDYLVFEGQARTVKVTQSTNRGQTVSEIRVADTDSPLDVKSGELVGLYKSRDEILGGFQDNLDTFTRTLVSEFNKVYASGQGLKGYQQVTSEFSIIDPTAALDAAGLTYPPVNGSLQVQVFNRTTGLTQTTDIAIDLNGLDHDTSLQDVTAALNAISGISASITLAGKLSIKSNSPDQEIAFANDTSGLLTALGINTFFTGTSAATLGVNKDVASDPAKFAASRSGVGEDTHNAVDLAGFLDRALDSRNGDNLTTLYSSLTSEVTQGSAVSSSVAEGFRTFEAALQGQSLATSGVSLDEEAIKMITLQRTFQASAKYIAALSELLDILVKL